MIRVNAPKIIPPLYVSQHIVPHHCASEDYPEDGISGDELNFPAGKLEHQLCIQQNSSKQKQRRGNIIAECRRYIQFKQCEHASCIPARRTEISRRAVENTLRKMAGKASPEITSQKNCSRCQWYSCCNEDQKIASCFCHDQNIS